LLDRAKRRLSRNNLPTSAHAPAVVNDEHDSDWCILVPEQYPAAPHLRRGGKAPLGRSQTTLPNGPPQSRVVLPLEFRAAPYPTLPRRGLRVRAPEE
jgi:hypothetical protein